jgi:RNA polymerase sporulation-specific sigma factor
VEVNLEKKFTSFEELLDEELVLYAHQGNEVALEYLINKYKNFVRAKAR